MTAADGTLPDTLRQIWQAGVAAVRGGPAVAAALAGVDRPDAIVAVGKAAADMAAAAADRYPGVPVLVVTKHGHGSADLPADATVIEASHPMPDATSLAAGRALLDRVSAMPAGSHLLLLVSGGASALAEVPRDGVDLARLAAMNARLLASGLDIHAMNAERRRMSRIKGGGLLAAFGGAQATVLAISDVQGDDVGVIGSGIGLVPPGAAFASETRVVGSNRVARAAAAAEAARLGVVVLGDAEALYGDVTAAAEVIAAALDGRPGLWIWGGEPTVVLPPDPGRGGRNQALAALVAERIAGRAGLAVLVAGTDGSDGPTAAAGGLVDGATWNDSGAAALVRADAGTWLETRGALFVTGPTGTNVMDLALALQG